MTSPHPLLCYPSGESFSYHNDVQYHLIDLASLHILTNVALIKPLASHLPRITMMQDCILINYLWQQSQPKPLMQLETSSHQWKR